jgi:peptide subunit release factor 1 (eRF1)
VGAVVGEALRGSVAVVGPDDVVLAVNEGRVNALFVEEDFERRGFQCDNCGALGPDVEAAEICPFCAGDLRAVQNLREALVARTIAAGGRVEIVPHEQRLHSYRGVAALLRQTAQTGLRGASPGSRAQP